MAVCKKIWGLRVICYLKAQRMFAVQQYVSGHGPWSVGKYFVNVCKWNTWPVKWIHFITHANKQNNKTKSLQNKTNKIEVINGRWSLSLVHVCLCPKLTFPVLCRDREAQLQRAARCHGLAQGWQRSLGFGGSREGKWVLGLRGVLAKGPKQVLHFRLLLLLLCLRVCGWCPEEKSN